MSCYKCDDSTKDQPAYKSYPTVLQKACEDSFDYVLKLRTGEIFRFAFAQVINREWVLIQNFWDNNPTDYPLPRGLEVRVADIVWIADAPMGS